MLSERKRLLLRAEFANAVTCSAALATPQVPINACILVWERQQEWTKWKSTGPAERRNKSRCPQLTASTRLSKEKGSSYGELLILECTPRRERRFSLLRRSLCDCFGGLCVLEEWGTQITGDKRLVFRGAREIRGNKPASRHQFSASSLPHVQKIFAGDDGFGRRAF